MTIPLLDDFVLMEVDNVPSYFMYRGPGFELCLEPCLNGYDVALYDEHQELIYAKECTNLKGLFTSLMAYEAALYIYVRLLENFENDQERLHNRKSDESTGKPGRVCS